PSRGPSRGGLRRPHAPQRPVAAPGPGQGRARAVRRRRSRRRTDSLEGVRSDARPTPRSSPGPGCQLMNSFHWAVHGVFLADLTIRLGLSARVIKRRLPVGTSLAWLAVVLVFPFVGAAIY